METRNIQINKQNILAVGMIVLVAILSRLIPHPANFVPIGALFLFSGARISGKAKYIIPFVVMIISDLFLGFHATMPFVYGALILAIFIGKYIKKTSFNPIFFSSILSSILFFIITNFGVWAMEQMYTKDINGLINAYIMGIPFFRNTLFSDLLYSFILFYGFEYITICVHKLNVRKV